MIGIVVTILLLLLMPSVSATWCNNNYGKKIPILINNTGGSEQNHYQIMLNYSYDSDMNANFSDARIYNESDCSIIPLWNESAVASSYNKIWFNATSVPASSWCNDTYYLYYNYSSASSVSNGTNTFEFFDDFENVTTKTKFEGFEKYASNPLTSIPHYSANGEVHPDVMYFPSGIDGYKYWMIYTPYPPNAEEHPCIVRSNNGIDWVDTGITNPVINHSGWEHDADPDMVYVSALSKWFMVWGPNTGSAHYEIPLAYSSDGKTWTEYDGATINGNTNPIILSGEDNAAEAWENDSGVSKIQYPSLIYESGTFYLFYGSNKEGGNRGKIGYATFTWNNTTNDVENFLRYASNPFIDLAQDSDFKSGCGHIDISKYGSTYYMYINRETLSSVNYELALLTSTDKINWTNKGKVLARGASGQWDDKHIYRASPVTDGEENIILFSDEVKLYYSGYKVSTGHPQIGFANGSEGTTIGELDSSWIKNDPPTIELSTTQKRNGNQSLHIYDDGTPSTYVKHNNSGTKRIVAWFYDDSSDTTSLQLLRLRSGSATLVAVGVYTGTSTTKYVYQDPTYYATSIDRTTGWHKLEIIAKADNTANMYIDGTSVASGVGSLSGWDTFGLDAYYGTQSYNYYDDVFVGKYASPEPTASLGTEESPSVTYTPPNPTNLQNTTGNFWVNYTWDAGDGNVTNSYNVSNETAWINGSSNTYLNESLEASEWLNITIYAWNSSGSGTLSAGSVSDQQQAPSVSTKKLYETSTSDFSAEVAVIDLYTSRDGTANNVAYTLATGTLYNYINATSNITVGQAIKIPAGTKVNFSAYFDDGDRVNYAYVTWKFYRLVGTSTTLICQKGDDSTGGVQIPDGTTETITGYCSVTSDVTLNSTDKVRLIMNVWAETIGGGGSATKVATHYWDSTHESWVEYKYQLTTTDTTFTVSLPVGYTKPVFEPPNSTATNYPPNGQTSSQEFFNVTNSGNVNLDVRMRLNTTVGTITLKADADNNPTGADTIGTSLVTIHSNLGQGSSVGVWLWSDFDHTPAQTANRTVHINVSQS